MIWLYCLNFFKKKLEVDLTDKIRFYHLDVAWEPLNLLPDDSRAIRLAQLDEKQWKTWAASKKVQNCHNRCRIFEIQ